VLKCFIEKLVEGRDLTFEEAKEAMGEIMSGGATDAQIGSFLTALRMKGETIDEISAFASAMSCLLYTSPSPRDRTRSRMPSSA